MRHCLATYTDLCVGRQASIWSMQIKTHRGECRVLTIDVDIPMRTIFEVRGRCNRMPSVGELVDRLTHRCHIFEMHGENFRFRESMKTKKNRKAEPEKR